MPSSRMNAVKNRSGRKFESTAEAVRAYVKLRKANATLAGLKKEWGIKAPSSTFSTVKVKMLKNGVSKKAKNGHNKSEPTKRKYDTGTTKKLKRRVEYLEWRLTGERQGFINELMADVAEEPVTN